MNEWKPLPHDEDLERADDLLDQADALLRRHRSTIDFTPGAPFHDAGRDQPSESNLESLDLEDEDLPILTEVVEDLEIADDWHPPINARPLDFGPIAPPALTPVAPGIAPAACCRDRVRRAALARAASCAGCRFTGCVG